MDEDYEPQSGRVWLDGDYVVLDCPPTTYEIALRRIPDLDALLMWQRQLRPKNWVTPETLRRFVRIVCEAKGWKI